MRSIFGRSRVTQREAAGARDAERGVLAEHWAAALAPVLHAAVEEPRVEAARAQRCGRALAHLMAVDAVGDDLRAGRERSGERVDVLRRAAQQGRQRFGVALVGRLPANVEHDGPIGRAEARGEVGDG